jgi:hypothetical protein
LEDLPVLQRFLLTIVVMVATTTASAVGQVTQQSGVTIRGVVFDSATLAPVPDAFLVIDDEILADQTDVAGSFQVSGLGAGSHALLFLKNGYSPRLFRFDVSDDHQGDVDVGLILLSYGPSPTAQVSGTVTDAVTELPVFGMGVSVNGVNTAVTNLDGRFSVPATAVRWGTNRIGFHRIGYMPMDVEFWTAQEWTEFDLIVTLDPLALEMPEVVVEGERTTYYFNSNSDFERRRKTTTGAFFTRRDIEQRNPLEVTDLLGEIPGVSVVTNSRGFKFVRMAVGRVGGCTPAIYVDGTKVAALPVEFSPETGEPLYSDVIIDWLVGTDEVSGIEAYTGPARVPAEFLAIGSDCGVIAIWTR